MTKRPRSPHIRLVNKGDPSVTNQLAKHYRLERGFAIIPIPLGTKEPVLKGWQKLEINTEAEIDKYFPPDMRSNIGVRLGPLSNDLVDADLDCREAVLLASYFLPTTDAIFGRLGKQRSHWLYYVHDAVGLTKAAIQLQDEEGGMLVELRLGLGARGAQTVFPGSVHTSGEEIEWAHDGDPADLTFGEALTAVNRLAAAALLLRGWPTVPGSRHHCAFVVGAFLARAGLNVQEVAHMVHAVAQEAGDNEIDDRVQSACNSAENTYKGEQTYGLPKMVEQFGQERVNKICKFLEYHTVDQEETLERMNGKYCILPIGDNAKMHVLTWRERGDRREAVFYRPDEFKILKNNERVGKARMGTWWLGHAQRRQYEGMVFRPGEPTEIDGELNLWQGWGINPKPGQWSLQRAHIKHVLAADDAAMDEFILKFSAWTFQNPGRRPEVALVLRGKEGCGKGVYGRAMKEAFGKHGMHISDHEHLVGKFNKHLMDCALLFCDEAWWPGHKAAEGTIKRMLTEPTLLIEPKRVDSFEVHNCLHVIMAANAEWVVAASPNARRFAVSNVADTRVGDKKYFRALYAEISSGGIAAMMNDLLAMDLVGWHPRENIPKSIALHDQQMLSLPPFEEAWLELLQACAIPALNAFLVAPSAVLYKLMRDCSPWLKNMSDEKLASKFKHYGCTRHNYGTQRGFKFPPLKEARARWLKNFPHTVWENDAEEWIKAEMVM